MPNSESRSQLPQKEQKELTSLKDYATCIILHEKEVLLVKRQTATVSDFFKENPLFRFAGCWGFLTESLEKKDSLKSNFLGAAVAGLSEELQLSISREQLIPLSAPLHQQVRLPGGIKVASGIFVTQPFIIPFTEKPTPTLNTNEIAQTTWVPLNELSNFLQSHWLIPGTWQTYELLQQYVSATT